MKTIVIGATGQIGRNLISQLLVHASRVTAVIRTFPEDPQNYFNATDESMTRLSLIVVPDFTNYDFGSLFASESFTHAFSVLGTTRKQAPNFSDYYRIDHDYALDFARAAKENDVKVFSIVTSMNASPSSSFNYLKLKSEIERDTIALEFPSLIILRPGLLVVEKSRKNTSWYEYISQKLICPVVEYLFPRQYTISVNSVAKAMVLSATKSSEQATPTLILENMDIAEISSTEV